MKDNCFEIVGGNKLFGEIKNQTSKNATLPILSASLLCDGEVKINEVPNITDVDNMLKILKKIGVQIKKEKNSVILNPTKADNSMLDCELSKTMRSSLFLLGPMLVKFGEVDLTLPGGCKIGARPIDIHIKAFEKLGVRVVKFDDHIFFKAEKPRPNKIKLKIPSVGATENIVQFACRLKGKTTIINPAREPEVVDLCNFLNQMGAKIVGAGTKKITIYGVDKFYSTEYKPMGDRIVAGTIMTAVALCGGNVKITNAVPYQNLKLIEILQKIGCQIDYKNDIINISREKTLFSLGKISTGFYPDFPTDLQSMMLALSCVAEGETTICENVFENRFLTVPELKKLGAKVELLNSKTAKVKGVESLHGETIEAKDLRGGASLVLLGLVANGKTVVKNIHFIDRGYVQLENILNSLGANTRRV
ncbi:MAG: UDP-N-acetylglucosamine 1-carboxyvinyltransferase [Clostridia bacterium]|nr:UDP-N-acetylglucosamine 1-carboxyvinyltransferase [Clostridia bacterium]